MVKNLPANQEMRVQSLGQEVSLEKVMATHSSILAGKSHGQRSLGAIVHRVTKESDSAWQLNNSKNIYIFIWVHWVLVTAYGI